MRLRPPAVLLVLGAALASSGCHEVWLGSPCRGVTCTGDGVCVTDGERAWCECPEGTRADGRACVPDCDSGGQCDCWTCRDEACDWIVICAGTFTMGSLEDESGRDDDEAPHVVTLTRDFEIAATEVTQSRFESLMLYNPSYYSEDGAGEPCGETCPVESVTWSEAAAYCNELSLRDGLEPCYDCRGYGATTACVAAGGFTSPTECPGFRLPTEAEWEYAARAGTTEATPGGDLDVLGCEPSAVLDDVAWHCGNTGNRMPRAVATRAPSPWGLYDMLGNVWELCHDGYVEALGASHVRDPSTPPDAERPRVWRGGSWHQEARHARSASRSAVPDSTGRHAQTGFRVVRTLESSLPAR